MKSEREQLLKEAILDWHHGKLDDRATLMIVSQIILPQEPCEKAIRWAIKTLQKLNIKEV